MKPLLNSLLLVFAAFIYYGATALGVVILRKKEPNLTRTYRVIGYPFIPIFFILFCIILVIVTLFAQPAQALAGLVLIGSGIPLYYYWRKNHSD